PAGADGEGDLTSRDRRELRRREREAVDVARDRRDARRAEARRVLRERDEARVDRAEALARDRDERDVDGERRVEISEIERGAGAWREDRRRRCLPRHGGRRAGARVARAVSPAGPDRDRERAVDEAEAREGEAEEVRAGDARGRARDEVRRALVDRDEAR